MNPIRPYGAGFNIDEPAAFASKIFDLMGQAVGDVAAADADVGGGGFVPPTKPKEEEAKPESIDPEVV